MQFQYGNTFHELQTTLKKIVFAELNSGSYLTVNKVCYKRLIFIFKYISKNDHVLFLYKSTQYEKYIDHSGKYIQESLPQKVMTSTSFRFRHM